jgi:predicted RNA-binding Zn-ribbon protein involved in translation (DUF1610 family)
MAGDRKYRQRGYQDSGKKEETRSEARPKTESFGPRALNMPGKRSVSRCAECGTVLPPAVDFAGNCPKCGAALHSCKQCSNFDPSARFECRQPIPARIARKDAANDCEWFAAKTTVERETSSGGARAGARAEDARKAFDNLFKKL